MILNPYRFGGATDFGLSSRDFDGTADYIAVPDDGAFSFGNGSTDSAFSVSAWINMDDATNFRFLSKWSNTLTAYEWIFFVNASDKLFLLLYDGLSNFRGRSYDTALTSFQSSWIHVAATYDGTGGTNAQNGINLYLTELGGSTTQVDDGDVSSGTYTAMSDTAAPVNIGRLETAAGLYANGKIADARIYSDVLTSGEIQNIADGIDHTPNLVGRWLGNDDNLLDLSGNDRHGTLPVPLPDNATFGDASRYFDGDSDKVVLTTSTDQFNYIHDDKLFSFACWVRIEDFDNTTSNVGNMIIAGNYFGNSTGSYFMYDGGVDYTKAFVFYTNRGGGLGTETFAIQNQISANGEWHHIAFTGSGGGTSTIRFYLDGTEVTSTTMTAQTDGDAAYDMQMGLRSSTTSNDFNGYMADVRFYTDELTAQEVADLYAGTDVAGNLVHHYFLNTNDTNDAVGSLDGTATGTAYQTADAGTFSTDGPLD